MRRLQSTTSAAPTRTFFGSQPRRAHVPPKGRESTMATCQPAERHSDAMVEAAEPVPTTTRSKLRVISNLPFAATAHLVTGGQSSFLGDAAQRPPVTPRRP